MSFALSRLERLYAQIESTYGQAPNSGGTATVANSNACRFIRFNCDHETAMIERPDKTGTRTAQRGNPGRRIGSWESEMTIAPNGVAGVAADMDTFMQLLFGQAGTATSGTATVTGATNATPIVITATNTFSDGDVIFISGVTGNTAANGVWLITATSGSAFTLVGSVGNGAYASGGTVSRVGYKYSISDSIKSASLWSFRQPSGVNQRVAIGSIATEGTFQLGSDNATASFRGESLWPLGSNQFSSADAYQKGGLTAFPSEPSSPVTNGSAIVGFTGKIAVNGLGIATLRNATVRFGTGNALVRDTFGSYYPDSAEGDDRNIGITFSVYEDDSATFAALEQYSIDKTPVSIPLFMGTTAGSIFGIVLNGVQLASPRREEQRRFIANFPESRAHGSSLTAKDECYAYFM